MEITALKPQNLWKHFNAICGIPHPSGHEAGIRAYIKNFAATNGIDYQEDRTGNVMLLKTAGKGREFSPRIILQAHMDMVPQKNSTTNFDFTRDPIQPYIDGDWVKASGTTLGADNGIGLAAALAVMEDQTFSHGPLKAIFTVEEETGLTGACNLSKEFLSGDILLNLDSEEDGLAFIGCAGGVRTAFIFNCDREQPPRNHVAVRLALTGLRGGHSGMDINNGRGNAIILLAQLLQEISTMFEVKLAALNGGSLDNAIPREAFADIMLPPDQEMEFALAADEWFNRKTAELGRNEPNMNLKLLKDIEFSGVMEPAIQQGIIDAVAGCRNGMVKMNPFIHDLVQTSTNLGVIKTGEGTVTVTCLQRSSVDAERDALVAEMSGFFIRAGATAETHNSYPGWSPDPKSPVLELLQQVYRELFQNTLTAKAVHAGLECGIFKGINPSLDMVSFGPEIRSPHSPDERVDIVSVEKFYRLLTGLLEKSI